MTHSIHNWGDLQIHFGVIFHETRHHTQAHITSGEFVHWALSLAVRRTQMSMQLGGWFRWPLFVMVTQESQNIFYARTWSSNQFGGGAILALSSFLSHIPHQKDSQILVVVFSSTWNWYPTVLLDPEDGKHFGGPLEGMSAHRIAISHMIRIVAVTHVSVVPFHDVRFHGADAVITKTSFCW